LGEGALRRFVLLAMGFPLPMLEESMGPRSSSLAPIAPMALVAALGFTTASLATMASDAGAQTVDARPWLGVQMDADAEGPGVRVGHVVRGSPAEKAGIREGDRIVRVAGATVVRGSDVVRTVSGHAVGEILEIALVRAGQAAQASQKPQLVQVTLARFPSQDEMVRMDLVGTFAPTWKDVETVNGAFPPSIDAVRGRVVLLDFWATWCAPCRIVAPKLGTLQGRYGAQGLSVLGVSTEDAVDVAQYAQRTAMRYPVAVDRHAETTRSYGVISLPTLVVIDRRGVVRDVAIGYDSSEDARLDSLVRSLLAEPPPAP
jgi:thiol-disulfide isomerase/thioredoxin